MTMREVSYRDKSRTFWVDGWQIDVTATVPYLDGEPRLDCCLLSAKLHGEVSASFAMELGLEPHSLFSLSLFCSRFGGAGFIKELLLNPSHMVSVLCYVHGPFSIDGREITVKDILEGHPDLPEIVKMEVRDAQDKAESAVPKIPQLGDPCSDTSPIDQITKTGPNTWEVAFSQKRTCPDCGGSGKKELLTSDYTCETCKGAGRV